MVSICFNGPRNYFHVDDGSNDGDPKRKKIVKFPHFTSKVKQKQIIQLSIILNRVFCSPMVFVPFDDKNRDLCRLRVPFSYN